MLNRDLCYQWPLILGYHSVSAGRTDALAVRVSDFEEQLAWLKRQGYRAVTLAQLMTEPLVKGERVVCLTFDDGYADNYTLAFPLLKKYGFVATMFLVSDYVSTDHIFYWDVPKLTAQADPAWYRLLTWEQVAEMVDYGIEMGSHTCTHPELTKVTAEQCLTEMTRSRQDLGARLGREIVSFCYPRGDLNRSVIQMAEKAGYSGAVVTPTCAGIPLGPYTLRRIGINYANSAWLFRFKTLTLVRRNYERLKRVQMN